ncbi:MAG: hypothetical protein JWQ72_3425, partial [Polaromonas sp.]|nr:hypothetical protein [Polaromonas sp.]
MTSTNATLPRQGRHFLALACALWLNTLLAQGTALAQGQPFPSKPIKL